MSFAASSPRRKNSAPCSASRTPSTAGFNCSKAAPIPKLFNAEIKAALPTERYEAYALNKDPIYRDAQSVARQVGAPADAVIPLYQINQASAIEQERIRTDATLTPEEQLEAIQIVQQEQLFTLRELLGDEAYKLYLRRAVR